MLLPGGYEHSAAGELLDFLREVGREFVVIGTKSDRLSSNALAKSVAALKRFHEVEELIPCSAKLGKQDRGLKQLWERLLALQHAPPERG